MNTIHLLLVDDEEQFLSTTKKILDKRGINTITCTNGFDALEILGKRRIDVVVLDIKMPGIDGINVLTRIKQDHPKVEVILLTGHASVESAVEGLKLGAFDYLTKPSRVSEIIAKVEEAFEKKRAKEEKARKAKIENIIRHPMALYEEDEG
jgi:DNA-binding NtrC family response regulator